MISIRSTLLVAVVAASFAPAQDLQADVVRDPGGVTATYTFDVGAPNGSTAWLFMSLTIPNQPLTFPGVLNQLEIDPNFVLPLCSFIPVQPIGGNCQVQLPVQPMLNAPLAFQGVVVDPALNIAFTPMAAAVLGAKPLFLPGAALQWAGTYNKNPNRYTLKLKGAPGANIRLLINGGQTAIGMAVLDQNGDATITIPVTLQKGDGLTIEENGVPVRSWTWF